MFGAYIHARPNGEAFYVGKGAIRRAHNLNRPRNPHHGNIVAKYGKENVLVSFIPCSTESIALELEIGLIKTFIRNGVKLTNMTSGGDGVSGLVHSDETRAKIRKKRATQQFLPETRAKLSAARAGKALTAEHRANLSSAAKGRKFTDEHRANIAIARKGRIITDETKAKTSAALKGNKNSLGNIQTAEHKAKISAANKGRVNTDESKKKMSESRIAYFAKIKAAKEKS